MGKSMVGLEGKYKGNIKLLMVFVVYGDRGNTYEKMVKRLGKIVLRQINEALACRISILTVCFWCFFVGLWWERVGKKFGMVITVATWLERFLVK